MIEQIICSGLIHDEDYARKVLPFLRSDYFSSRPDRLVYELIDEYYKKYSHAPSKDAIAIELSKRNNVDQDLFDESLKLTADLKKPDKAGDAWLLDTTEKFCQEQALYNAIMRSVEIMDKDAPAKGSIPKILQDALSVTFDPHVGHDYFDASSKRLDYYNRVEHKIPFDIEVLNDVTKGGFSRKSLNIFLGSTGTGKSLVMCHLAGSNLMTGHNVLYLTMEMAEEEIAKRIDANLLGIDMDSFSSLTPEAYERKISKIRQKTTGRLIVKEYPTGAASVTNFRYLLNELRLKKNFVPDVIYVDYINICTSARYSNSSNVNSYGMVKAIVEELRGLAVEFDACMISATQTNRDGMDASDVDMKATSECIYVNEKLTLLDGSSAAIGSVKPGQRIVTNDGYKTVMLRHHSKTKECIEITTRSGKKIVVSKDHKFPTSSGRISFNSGLKEGVKLNVRGV